MSTKTTQKASPTKSPNELEAKIDNNDWTLFDRFMYGGLGHGYLCLPSNLIKVFVTVIFPPLGIILKHLNLSSEFPYFTSDSATSLFENIGDVIYSFVLTALFYIPGLIYGLSNLKCAETDDESAEKLKDITDEDIKNHFKNIKKRKNIKAKQQAAR